MMKRNIFKHIKALNNANRRGFKLSGEGAPFVLTVPWWLRRSGDPQPLPKAPTSGASTQAGFNIP